MGEGGGGEKIQRLENVKRKSAGRSQRADVSGGGGGREGKLFDGWAWKRARKDEKRGGEQGGV